MLFYGNFLKDSQKELNKPIINDLSLKRVEKASFIFISLILFLFEKVAFCETSVLIIVKSSNSRFFLDFSFFGGIILVNLNSSQ